MTHLVALAEGMPMDGMSEQMTMRYLLVEIDYGLLLCKHLHILTALTPSHRKQACQDAGRRERNINNTPNMSLLMYIYLSHGIKFGNLYRLTLLTGHMMWNS